MTSVCEDGGHFACQVRMLTEVKWAIRLHSIA